MDQVNLNREDSERILANPDSDPDFRVIAATALAFFEINEHAGDIAKSYTFAIVQKLLHIIQAAIYEAREEREDG